MNSERHPAPEQGRRDGAGGGPGRRAHAPAVMLLLIALLAPPGAAAQDATGSPLPPDTAAAHAGVLPAAPSASPAQERRDPLPDEIEEAPEPFIADDLRTEGLMYAAAEITTAISWFQRPLMAHARCGASHRSASCTGMPLRRA